MISSVFTTRFLSKALLGAFISRQDKVGQVGRLPQLFKIEGNSLQGIPLIHYVEGEIPIPFILVQFGFAWLLLFMIKSSMTDDKQLDIYEGFTITIAQVFVFVIFLKGMLGF